MLDSKAKQNPILIAAPPRSGTTLVTGLLGKHGVWIGRGGVTKYPGTNPNFVSENTDIKAIFKQEAKKQGYRNWASPVEYLSSANISKQTIDALVPAGRVWLVKTAWNLIFYTFWQRNYPNAHWIFPRRSREAILNSMNRHPGMAKHPDSVKRPFIDGLQRMQDELFNTVGYGLFVDVDKLAKVSEGEIIKLFGFIGIMPNWSIINDWIDPTRWHTH